MDSVTIFLLAIAAIFLIGAVGELVFQRTNVPDVIWLIVAGILLGPVTGMVTREQLTGVAPYFAALTLVVVLFEGGSALKLGDLSRAAPRSTLLAVVNFVFSVAGIALLSTMAAAFGVLSAEWTWTHGLLLGIILGGSSSIIIMPAMAQARVQPALANLVSLESALTDAFCVVGTAAVIDVMLGGAAGAGGPAGTLARSFGIGLGLGAVAGLLWLLFLRLLHSHEHAYPVTLSALLVLYVIIDRAGGSAALGILTVAVILGNAPSLGKWIGLSGAVELDQSVRGFHRQVVFIIKSFFFVFIGAMLAPPWGLILLGVALGLTLLLVRVPGTRLSLLKSGFGPAENAAATVCLPRGMAAGVLATLPVSAGVPGTDGLPVAVFAAVFTTILVFAVGFPLVKRRMVVVEGTEIAVPAGAAMPSIRPPAADEPIATARTIMATSRGALSPQPAFAEEPLPVADPLSPPMGPGTAGGPRG